MTFGPLLGWACPVYLATGHDVAVGFLPVPRVRRMPDQPGGGGSSQTGLLCSGAVLSHQHKPCSTVSQSGQAYMAPRLGLATSPAQRQWGCSTAVSRLNWATHLGQDMAKFRHGPARSVFPSHPGSFPIAWLFLQPPLTSAKEPLPLAPPQRSLTAEQGQGSALAEWNTKYLGCEQQSRDKSTGPGSCHGGTSSAAQ